LEETRDMPEPAFVDRDGERGSHATGISSVLAWIALMVGQTSGSMSG